MELALRDKPYTFDCAAEPFPAEVELIVSALQAAAFSGIERRPMRRAAYRTRAYLRLFSDSPTAPPWLLYTRDVNGRGIGFVTTGRLPLGYGGVLELAAPDGRWLSVGCTLLRCREAAPGWFDGGVYFNRHQPDFAALTLE